MIELVNHPDHYGGEDNQYETIKVLRAWGLDRDAYLWNVGKYISRAGKKSGNSLLQDLKKAAFYLDYRIKDIERESCEQSAAEYLMSVLKQNPAVSNKPDWTYHPNSSGTIKNENEMSSTCSAIVEPQQEK